MAYTKRQRTIAIRKVLDGLSKGTPLAVICRAKGMPTDKTIREWADADEELAFAIARAREVGFDAIAVEALQIIDEAPERVVVTSGEDRTETRIDSAAVQWAKNRAELRLKLLAKWDPKRYGDKIDHTSSDGSMTPTAPVYNITST